MKKLSLANIKEIFDCEPETGKLFWKIQPGGGVKVGDVTGNLSVWGYLQTIFCGKSYRTHRLIFAWFHGRWPKDQIDHINGIRTDNRISNLREATSSENNKNARLRKDNKSGCVGVYWSKRDSKWCASIRVDNRHIHLGYFIHPADAIKARKAAEVKHGFHPNHGSVLEKGIRACILNR